MNAEGRKQERTYTVCWLLAIVATIALPSCRDREVVQQVQQFATQAKSFEAHARVFATTAETFELQAQESATQAENFSNHAQQSATESETFAQQARETAVEAMNASKQANELVSQLRDALNEIANRKAELDKTKSVR